ncbi:MAG: membrane dipeptidase [Acidobacteriota bacterium]
MKRTTFFRTIVCSLLAMSIVHAQSRVITLPQRLFGWADLHAHPASHLAFGANNGNDGIFHGKPGGKWTPNSTSIYDDLPRCNYIHGGTDLDLIRHETHKALMGQLDEVGGYPHLTADFGDNNFGSPSFEQWPNARSISHQQMHITQIRRAYEGGQRLMVASVTDNEFLNDMWTEIGYNALGNPVPAITPDFGYKSAAKQLFAIRKQVGLNSDWMEVAYTAADARRIISSNKMAVILGVEMDSLTITQIEKLVKEEGVRQVIPIHLIDNLFGGTAVYSDAFNAVNNFYWSSRNGGNLNNDGFLKVDYDPTIEFKLGRPSYPRPEGNNILLGGAIHLDPIPMSIFNTLGYQKNTESGHVNAKGLAKVPYPNPIGFGTLDFGAQLLRSLAKSGVMIDISHMGTKSTRDTLDMVGPWHYPVMSSHTDIRPAQGKTENERALERSQAQRIGKLGGVIGLGTDWPHGFESVVDPKVDTQWNVLLGYQWSPYVPVAYESPKVKLVKLAGDPEVTWLKIPLRNFNVNSNGKLFAVVTIDGKEHTYQLNKFNESWAPATLHTPTIELPAHTRSSQLQSFRFKVNPGTAWSINEFQVLGVPMGRDPIATWLDTYQDGLALLGGKGMAIGTDINGFAPQLWLPAEDVQYPIHLAHDIGPSKSPWILGKDTLGTRQFDFKKDGIAHYGMLPDFLAAVSQQPDAGSSMDKLFHSVEDVVAMWEKCEKAKVNVK